ncbi:MAG: NAD(P)-dependent alcohol dehydrogenase [Spirochaetota bacterium]
MKAICYTEYGPPEVLHRAEIPEPVQRRHEVLVKIQATSVTIGDTIMRSLNIPVSHWQKIMSRLYLGWNKPKRPILGMELAGTIKSVGDAVTRFKPGDEVFASTFAVGFGAYSEYICLPEKGVLALRPRNLTAAEAAVMVGAGMTALSCLKKAGIRPGQKVLVYGASGAVGTNAIQLAAHHFKADVTGICSTANLDLAKTLGANKVIDYKSQDITQTGPIHDVVFDAVGKLSPAQGRKLLKAGGVYLNVHTDSDGGNTLANLLALKEIIEAGQLRPVIDRVYPIAQIVEAHAYVEQGHKKGNVIIMVEDSWNGGSVETTQGGMR